MKATCIFTRSTKLHAIGEDVIKWFVSTDHSLG